MFKCLRFRYSFEIRKFRKDWSAILAFSLGKGSADLPGFESEFQRKEDIPNHTQTRSGRAAKRARVREEAEERITTPEPIAASEASHDSPRKRKEPAKEPDSTVIDVSDSESDLELHIPRKPEVKGEEIPDLHEVGEHEKLISDLKVVMRVFKNTHDHNCDDLDRVSGLFYISSKITHVHHQFPLMAETAFQQDLVTVVKTNEAYIEGSVEDGSLPFSFHIGAFLTIVNPLTNGPQPVAYSSLKPNSMEAKRWLNNWNKYCILGENGLHPLAAQLVSLFQAIIKNMSKEELKVVVPLVGVLGSRMLYYILRYRDITPRKSWDVPAFLNLERRLDEAKRTAMVRSAYQISGTTLMTLKGKAHVQYEVSSASLSDLSLEDLKHVMRRSFGGFIGGASDVIPDLSIEGLREALTMIREYSDAALLDPSYEGKHKVLVDACEKLSAYLKDKLVVCVCISGQFL